MTHFTTKPEVSHSTERGSVLNCQYQTFKIISDVGLFFPCKYLQFQIIIPRYTVDFMVWHKSVKNDKDIKTDIMRLWLSVFSQLHQFDFTVNLQLALLVQIPLSTSSAPLKDPKPTGHAGLQHTQTQAYTQTTSPCLQRWLGLQSGTANEILSSL